MATQPRRFVPAFTPSMLAAYERCPQQYHRRYVRKDAPTEGFNGAFACGNAAHAVLASVLECYRRTGGLPVDVLARVQAALPRDGYADDAVWTRDVAKVLGWVKWGLMTLDPAVRIVLVERWGEYAFPGNADCPAFRLRHRLDLAFEHPDGAIELLDWKSGDGYRIDELQNVTARILTRQSFPEAPRILSSTAFLANETIRTDELTRTEVQAVWRRIKALVAGILAEQAWLPVSNALCPWCPLYQRGCALYPDPDQSDATTDWLEGAA